MNQSNSTPFTESPDIKPFVRVTGLVLGLYVLNSLFDNGSDTVNYILWHKKRIVYHGICYADRVDARLNEHVSNGFVFDEYDYDRAKPRLKARQLEKKRIMRDKPKYNNHHNY